MTSQVSKRGQISVYLYSGDLHEVFAGKEHFPDMARAMEFIQTAVETGMMVNIVHSDFEIPSHRLQEAVTAEVVTPNHRRLQ